MTVAEQRIAIVIMKIICVQVSNSEAYQYKMTHKRNGFLKS
jgi:hypothetical protein